MPPTCASASKNRAPSPCGLPGSQKNARMSLHAFSLCLQPAISRNVGRRSVRGGSLWNSSKRLSNRVATMVLYSFHPRKTCKTQRSAAPPPWRADPSRKKRPIVHEDEPPMNTKTDGPPSTTSGPGMLLQYCSLGVTMSWEEAHPGARASRPHKSSRSLAHLLDPDRPATDPWFCFGRAHAVPSGRATDCRIAGKLSANRRERMRAGRPRSQGVSSRS